MGTCENCKKKIMYNKYKRYRKTILCLECYNTRLDRKAAKRAGIKARAKKVKIIAPTKKAKKAAKEKGISLYPLSAEDELVENKDDENGKGKTAETSD